MRFLLIALFIFSVNVNADEIQRIELIVNDIKKLRLDYDKSQEALTLSQVQLKDERDKNEILLKELELKENELNSFKNQIKKLKSSNLLDNSKKVIIKEKIEICKENQINKENKFPILQMKEKKDHNPIINTKAQTYRLNKDANLYNGKDGKIVDIWENKTSFTSNLKSGSWIKVTGYFVEKKWKKSTNELWVKEADTKHR